MGFAWASATLPLPGAVYGRLVLQSEIAGPRRGVPPRRPRRRRLDPAALLDTRGRGPPRAPGAYSCRALALREERSEMEDDWTWPPEPDEDWLMEMRSSEYVRPILPPLPPDC